jgi:transcriptional regulator with XRE-family HTH domain
MMIATILIDFDDVKNEQEREAEMKVHWGEFVKNMRMAAGLSKAKFAEKLGVSPNSIKQYEKAQAFPRHAEDLELKIREVVKLEIQRKRSKVVQLQLAV